MQREVIEWFAQAGRDLPWRQKDFTAWGSLVSEFMLQQTPVPRVIPRLDAWLTRWPTPADLAADSAAEAVRMWQNLGYPRRALWLHACAVDIVNNHGGEVPHDVESLLRLPGVGPYTARAVAVFAFGAHEAVVDTNIRRVIARAVHGKADQGSPSTARDLADMSALLPDSATSPAFNAGLMELGALVCTARQPQCQQCPISQQCLWRARGFPQEADRRPARQARYEGSDRQVRGIVLKALREETSPVHRVDLAPLWPDAGQLDRAIVSLLHDGLIQTNGDALSLPE